jgi:hypothetical protein
LAGLVLTGFALAFARGVGEYGSVIFIAGNLPYVSEIAPLLIVIKLEEFDYRRDGDRGDHAGDRPSPCCLVINLIQAAGGAGQALWLTIPPCRARRPLRDPTAPKAGLAARP